jgi:hypothetical protein
MMRGNCGRMPLKGNSALILISGKLDWWTETRTAEPFSGTMRNGFWDFGVRIPVGWKFGLGKFLELWTGAQFQAMRIIIWSVKRGRGVFQ